MKRLILPLVFVLASCGSVSAASKEPEYVALPGTSNYLRRYCDPVYDVLIYTAGSGIAVIKLGRGDCPRG